MKKKKRIITVKTKKIIKNILYILLIVMFLFAFVAAVCNITVISSAKGYILTFEEACQADKFDCILVLGAGLRSDGTPSNILSERIEIGAELYLNGVSQRVLVSGDNSRSDYNEVGVMKDYMIERGINAKHIFTDHAGFDTYDTAYRAKEIFKANRVLIVTQDFHLSRAVFVARSLGLDAYGVACDTGRLGVGYINELREAAARTKYVAEVIFKPEPKHLGEAIPIWDEADYDWK